MVSKREQFVWLVTGLAGLAALGFWMFTPVEWRASPGAADGSSRAGAREQGRVTVAGATGPETPATGWTEMAEAGKAEAKVEAVETNEARVRELLRRDFDGLTETRRPGGGYGVALNGRFRHLSVALPGAENVGVARCFCDADGLLHALNTPHRPLTR